MTMVNHLGPCYCSFKWFVMLMWNPFSLNLLLEGKQVHGLVVKYGMAASPADLLDSWDTSVLVVQQLLLLLACLAQATATHHSSHAWLMYLKVKRRNSCLIDAEKMLRFFAIAFLIYVILCVLNDNFVFVWKI